jgi:uncharacterized membrane protein YtjA (UPF0391 family)
MELLGWALVFLVVALVAGAFGFRGTASAAATVAKILFGIFLVIFVLLLVFGLIAAAAL